MLEDGAILIGKGTKPETLLLKLANRHGLVTGATGTGKTVTLQVLAEGFSNAGVPVFAADIKGDLSGVAAPGERQGGVRQARAGGRRRLRSRTAFRSCSGMCSANRATRSARPCPRWGRCCWRACSNSTTCRRASSTSPSGSPTTILPVIDLKDLRALLTFVAENDKAISAEYGNVAKAAIGAIQRQLLMLENQGADKFFGEPALEPSRTL